MLGTKALAKEIDMCDVVQSFTMVGLVPCGIQFAQFGLPVEGKASTLTIGLAIFPTFVLAIERGVSG